MHRLCERPACAVPAEVAYGFDADHLVVWLDAMHEVRGHHGVLCRRHADAMVVPLGWMLDDRREPTLRLFKAPPATERPAPARRVRRARGGDETDQLTLLPPEVVEAAVAAIEREPEPERALEPEPEPERVPEPVGEAPPPTPAPAWVPVFDPEDDLSGLLKARGRLLSRAFRSAPAHEN